MDSVKARFRKASKQAKNTKGFTGKKPKDKHSDGYWHIRITLAFTPIAFALGCLAVPIPLEWWQRGIIAFIGCLGGIIISPDLDLEALSISETIWTKIPIIGYTLTHFWSWFWTPYASLFRHRGSSHSVLLGTAGRIIYLLIWVPICLCFITLLSYLVLHMQGVPVGSLQLETSILSFFSFISNFIWYIVCFCVGLFVSDVGHILRDKRGLQL